MPALDVACLVTVTTHAVFLSNLRALPLPAVEKQRARHLTQQRAVEFEQRRAPRAVARCTRQKHGTPTASRATEYTRLWCILGSITKFTENFEKIYTYSFHSTLTTYKILRSNSLYFSGISVLLAHEICIRSSYIVAYLACNNK